MEQSPFWEDDRLSASQEIPCIVWNPNVHSCIYKSPLSVPILSYSNTVHDPVSYFLKIQFNIIF